MRMKNQQKIIGILAFMLVLTTVFAIIPVVQAATEKEAGGTFTLNAQPTVTGVDYQTDALMRHLIL